MYGIKLGWIIPIIILFVLFVVIGVGVYQINSDRNPWFFGEEPAYNKNLLDKE
jgi:hypothetical protein